MLAPRGLQIGATTRIEIQGEHLTPQPRLWLPIEGAIVKVAGQPAADELAFEIELLPTAKPGVYPLAVVTSGGISSLQLIAVDAWRQSNVTAEAGELPVALTGRVGSTVVVKTHFDGERDQAIEIDVEAARLGSQISPMLHLYDSDGRQTAWAAGSSQFGGDARIVTRLPRTGRYRIELHEASFRGGTPNHFRLKIGPARFTDRVFPLGGRAATRLEVFTTNSGHEKPALWKVDLPNRFATIPAWPPTGVDWSGPPPPLVVDRWPEFIEPRAIDPQAQAGQPAAGLPPAVKLTPPLAIEGCLVTKGEVDRYVLDVEPGATWKVGCYAARAGSPLAARLVVERTNGERIAASADEAALLDPELVVTIPAETHQVVLTIADLAKRGGRDYLYRLRIAPADEPRVAIVASPASLVIPRGGTALVEVRAEREHCEEAISLEFSGLPADWKVSPTTLPARAKAALIGITPPADADGAIHALTILARPLSQPTAPAWVARSPAFAALAQQPWLSEQIPLAVIAAPLTVTWERTQDRILPGERYPGRARFTRLPQTPGDIRLTLITTQPMARKKEKDVEIDDLDRMVRLPASPLLIPSGDEAATVDLEIPADLPAGTIDIALQADLLDPKTRTPVMTVTTRPVRLVVGE